MKLYIIIIKQWPEVSRRTDELKGGRAVQETERERQRQC